MLRAVLPLLALFVSGPAFAFDCAEYAQDTFTAEAANLGAELAAVESARVKAGAQDAFDARKALDKTAASNRAKTLRQQLPCATEASEIKLARVFFLLGIEGQRRMPPEPESERFLQVALLLLGEEIGVQSTIDAWTTQLGADLKPLITKAQDDSRGKGAIYADRSAFAAGLSLHGLPPNPPWVLTPGPITLDSGVESMQATVKVNKVTLLTPKDLSTATLAIADLNKSTTEDDFVQVERSFDGPQTGLVLGLGVSSHLAPLSDDFLPEDGAIVPASYGGTGASLRVGALFRVGALLLYPRVEVGSASSAVDGTPSEDYGIPPLEKETLKFLTVHADAAFSLGPVTVSTGPMLRTVNAELVGAHGTCTDDTDACERSAWQEFAGVTTVGGWGLFAHYAITDTPILISAGSGAMTDGTRNYFSPNLTVTYTLGMP